MKKIHLSLNPIEGRENWLNKIAKDGYALKRIYSGIIYEFEKTDKNYKYGVQYIGYMSYEDRKNYEYYLKDRSNLFWSVPLNFLSFSIGKVKYRPYADKNSKVVTSNKMINNEILIIEDLEESESKFEIFTDFESKISNLKHRRNLNVYLLIISIFLMLFGNTTGFLKGYDLNIIKNIVAIILIVISSLNIVKISRLISTFKKENFLFEK